MAEGIYRITEQFEEALCNYTGAPHCCAVDNGSNALFLSLKREGIAGREIAIPARTYPSVPCEILHAGGRVRFLPAEKSTLTGAYPLLGSRTWDSALRFTADMYLPGTFMCLSFSGPYKRLKLGKAGAILTDDYAAALWFKRARFSGRRECSYHGDAFDMTGWNMYLLPEIAARGLREMAQFYDLAGRKIVLPDLELPYPDLSQHPAYGGTAP